VSIKRGQNIVCSISNDISYTSFLNKFAAKSHVAQSCYSVIGDKPFLWSKPKFDPP